MSSQAHAPMVRRPARRAHLLALAILLALLGSICWSATANAYVYWTNEGAGTIGRAQTNGMEVEQEFITGAEYPDGIAVDGAYIYWANRTAGVISRARLDGSEPEYEYITGINEPTGIAAHGSYIYFTERYTDYISVANVETGEVDYEAFKLGSKPNDLAISPNGEHLYWTYFEHELNYIGELNLTELTPTPDEHFYKAAAYESLAGIAADSEHLYWDQCDDETNALSRSTLEGTEESTEFIPEELVCPTGIAVDGAHIYWANDQDNAIGRSTIEGGEVEQDLITGANEPANIALSEPTGLDGSAPAEVQLGDAVDDEVELFGSEPTGKLIFRLYGPEDATCSNEPVYTSEVEVSGNSVYGSPEFTPTEPGTYRWTVSYSGGGVNEPEEIGCNTSEQSVVVAGGTTTTTTTTSTASTTTATSTTTVTSSSATHTEQPCRSARSEAIHWKLAGGVRLKRILVTVNGKLYRTLPGRARHVTVSLHGFGAGRVAVRILGIGDSGRRYSEKRVYRPCYPDVIPQRVGNAYLKAT